LVIAALFAPEFIQFAVLHQMPPGSWCEC
jgi:hypothetical protein